MAALALASASAHASDRSYTDHELASRDGKKWITRTAALTDFDGGQVVVELRLFEDGKGGLVYRYDDQTEATKLYHQASCEETGAEVRRGDTVLGGESVAAWSCMGVADKQAESEKSTESTDAPRAAYYVHALAPSGSAPLGVNFHSVGIARYQSSIAGESNGNVSIDNGRCTASAVDHHTGPFVGGLYWHSARTAQYLHVSMYSEGMFDRCRGRGRDLRCPAGVGGGISRAGRAGGGAIQFHPPRPSANPGILAPFQAPAPRSPCHAGRGPGPQSPAIPCPS